MMNCDEPSFLLGADVVWVEAADDLAEAAANEAALTIGELAEKFGITPRTVRFYEARGMIRGERKGRRPLYDRRACERLALIVKGRKLGFTLTDIAGMIAANEGTASAHVLKLGREKCQQQIRLLYQRLFETEEALAELRRIYVLLSRMDAGARPEAE